MAKFHQITEISIQKNNLNYFFKPSRRGQESFKAVWGGVTNLVFRINSEYILVLWYSKCSKKCFDF